MTSKITSKAPSKSGFVNESATQKLFREIKEIREGDFTRKKGYSYNQKLVEKYIIEQIPELGPFELDELIKKWYTYDVSIIRLMVDGGANPRIDNDILFIKSCGYRGNLELVKYFLECGADINAQDSQGLIEGIPLVADETIKFLLDNGMKITQKAIDRATECFSHRIVQIFLEAGTNPNTMLKSLLSFYEITTEGDNYSRDFRLCLKVINKFEPNYEKVINELDVDQSSYEDIDFDD